MAEIWENFNEVKPEGRGYYMIRYRNKDGNIYYKAIWWNGEKFTYNPKGEEYVTEVLEFINDRYDYYVPCMYQDHSKEIKCDTPEG